MNVASDQAHSRRVNGAAPNRLKQTHDQQDGKAGARGAPIADTATRTSPDKTSFPAD
ncbi:hypothetical protein PO124_04460 [Bacillus licheniformis]|nr:hypothetical protein [Bacillus licheniformis]